MVNMDIVLGTNDAARLISLNNIQMAKETENLDINPNVALRGVRDLLEDPSKGFYLCAKQDDAIIGQLMITFEWSDWRDNTIWWIQSVYVHPDFRDKGVFHALYDHVAKQAKIQGISIIRLYVHHQNTPAISVYQRIGMKKTNYVMFEREL